MESYGLVGFTTFTTTLSSLIVLLNIVIALLHLRKSRSRLLLSLPRYGHSSPLMAASFHPFQFTYDLLLDSFSDLVQTDGHSCSSNFLQLNLFMSSFLVAIDISYGSLK